MTEPWCRRLKAPRGDSSPDSIFCGVARALTMWEMVEYHISIAYQGLIRSEQSPADKYLRTASFAARHALVKKAIDTNVNRKDCSGFGEFIDKVEKYSDRRHEIAHGWAVDFGEHGFYLYPNTTMRDRNFPNSTAAYYYASDDIEFYCDQFTNLAETAKDFAERLAHRSLHLSG
jgi:hypothetical protein